jgi:hypothetical protein
VQREILTRSTQTRRTRRFCREQCNIPATPKDAAEATEQRELQQKLNHRNDDPDALGRHQNRNQTAEDT